VSLDAIGWLLVFVWFLFMATAVSWLPAYHGNIDRSDRARVIALFVVIAVLGAIKLVRARAQTKQAALMSSLPAMAVLAAAAVGACVLNRLNVEFRGEPLFLFFGVALWASWAVVVLSTALLSRARWNGLGGLGLTSLVALLGLFMATARID
jgi:hypothetical protein